MSLLRQGQAQVPTGGRAGLKLTSILNRQPQRRTRRRAKRRAPQAVRGGGVKAVAAARVAVGPQPVSAPPAGDAGQVGADGHSGEAADQPEEGAGASAGGA